MKKFKHFVIGGIENKVFNLILVTVLLLTAAFTAVTYYHSGMLARLAQDSAAQQQAAIAETSGSVMNAVVENSMTRSMELETAVADELFQDLRTQVTILGNSVKRLFEEPGLYARLPYSVPELRRNGELYTQAVFAAGVDPEDAAIADRVGLAANLSELMKSCYRASGAVSSLFIGFPEGAFLITDNRSAAKFDETGALSHYDPSSRFWYKQAVEQRQLIFTDVETDAFTGDVGIVCAMPVYVDDKLVAVVGADLFLSNMRSAVEASDENGGFVFVVNQQGHVVFSPKTEGIFGVRPSSEAIDLRMNENAALASLVQTAMARRTEVRTLSTDEGEYYIIGAPLKTVGWALVSVQDRATVEQPALLMQENFAAIQGESVAAYQRSTKDSRATATVLLVVIMLVMLASALIVGKRIVRPLNSITRRIADLKGENLEFKMEPGDHTGDEIEVLSESFAALSHKTVEYIDQVKTVTAEKERIGTELSLATNIQASMLPHIFPAFPDRPEFDIYASMDPAKEVGGDFYDYFLVDDDHLCMVMADVSGKGVPAALFMMASKIIIQSYSKLGNAPADILAHTNRALCSSNEAEMFVTVWLGILELSTGLLTAANAGHEYPVIRQPGGAFELFKDKHGFVLGGMDGARYRDYSLTLEPGARVFVYTDGVPEATNASEELFGTERMLAALNRSPECCPQDALKNVRAAVDDFVKDAEQFDDLTMLCLEYRGKQKNIS